MRNPMDVVVRKVDDLAVRLRKLENAPLPAWMAAAQPEKPRDALDPQVVLRELLSDPELGEAVRLKMLQLEQERVR